MRPRPIDVVVGVRAWVRVRVCVKIISKVICWRNVISRQCCETWCTKVRHVHIYIYIDWTHIKMRFAMAIFVWHASFCCCCYHYITASSLCQNRILNSLTFRCTLQPEPSVHTRTCMHTDQTHYTHWKWKMERTHTEKKVQNEIKVNCVVAFDSAFCSAVCLCVRPFVSHSFMLALCTFASGFSFSRSPFLFKMGQMSNLSCLTINWTVITIQSVAQKW